MAKTVEADKNVGCVVKCYCSNCNNDTNHEIVKNIKFDDDEQIEDRYSISWYDDFQVIMCRGCELISFRQASYFSEDWHPDHNGVTYTQYPGKRLREPMKIEKLSVKVKNLYHEVIGAYNIEAHTLTAGGLRALIEAICSDKGIAKGMVPFKKKDGTYDSQSKSNLEGKIYGLHENGYISKMQIDVLHELRFLGNVALHEIEKPKQDQIDLAFKIIESMLENIYGMDHKAKILKDIREKH